MGPDPNSYTRLAMLAFLVMFVALVVYLAFGVRSFIDARRARQA